MSRIGIFLLILSAVNCYRFNTEERSFAKDFYFEECLHSGQTVCVAVNFTAQALSRTCVADETQCTGDHSAYLKRSACAECSDFWCEDTFLCTNEESLCGTSKIVTTCDYSTPSCYSRGTIDSKYDVCTCAPGFIGDSCSECESSPKHSEMEYICCEDTSFEHGISLIAVKKKDISGFLKGEYTSGNCTSKVINDCDCISDTVDHAENQNPYLYYQGMNTNDTKSSKKAGQGLIAFVVSVAVGLMLVCALIISVYYINKRSKKKKTAHKKEGETMQV